MKKVFVFLLVCLITPVVSYAQLSEGGRPPLYDYASPDPCGAIEAGRPCYASKGNYASCTAIRGAGQMCQTRMADYLGNRSCASVEYSAHCQCDNATTQVSGICTYMK